MVYNPPAICVVRHRHVARQSLLGGQTPILRGQTPLFEGASQCFFFFSPLFPSFSLSLLGVQESLLGGQLPPRAPPSYVPGAAFGHIQCDAVYEYILLCADFGMEGLWLGT